MSTLPVVHPTAVLDGDIGLADGVIIGPHCVLTGNVTIGPRTIVKAHTVIEGRAAIGADCVLGPNAAVGTPPQHRGYDGADTRTVLGDRVVVREFATVHRASTPGDGHATVIGEGCLLMACAHAGHDCRLGRNVTLANTVLLAGHVTVGDGAFVSGGVVVHQFSRVGRLAMVGGGEICPKDVLPFGMYRHHGHRAYNAVGCRRAGMSPAELRDLRAAYTLLYGHRSFAQAAAAVRDGGLDGASPLLRELIEFIETSHRGVQPAANGRGGETD